MRARALADSVAEGVTFTLAGLLADMALLC
jgi:hypothetical protein